MLSHTNGHTFTSSSSNNNNYGGDDDNNDNNNDGGSSSDDDDVTWHSRVICNRSCNIWILSVSSSVRCGLVVVEVVVVVVVEVVVVELILPSADMSVMLARCFSRFL